ncbi:MAG: DUF4129 domain-containing protein [Gemmatimonadota bacterium]
MAASRADTLRATLDSVFASPVYRWETREDPFGAARRLWRIVGDNLARLHERNPDAFRLLGWVLVAILGAIIAHAAWIAVRTVRGGSRGTPTVAQGPPTTARDAAWYAHEAARLARDEQFVAAMQADFLRLVLELDGRRLLSFHPSKTPSEYARDPALHEDGRRALRELVGAMYAHAFARVPLDRALYDRWRAAATTERYAPSH